MAGGMSLTVPQKQQMASEMFTWAVFMHMDERGKYCDKSDCVWPTGCGGGGRLE